MLAIQVVHIEWHKSERNLKSSEIRNRFGKSETLKGIFVPDSENSDIFLNYNHYFQDNSNFKNITQYRNESLEYFNFVTKQAENDYQRKTAEIELKNQGSFYNETKKLKIPCVEIQQHNDDYKIRWYSNLSYMPVRQGRNERYFSNTEFRFKNALNHTVFVLRPNESGKLQYNYRCVYCDTGIWQYNMLYVYLINTEDKIIKPDIFTKANYKYDYKELAELF